VRRVGVERFADPPDPLGVQTVQHRREQHDHQGRTGLTLFECHADTEALHHEEGGFQVRVGGDGLEIARIGHGRMHVMAQSTANARSSCSSLAWGGRSNSGPPPYSKPGRRAGSAVGWATSGLVGMARAAMARATPNTLGRLTAIVRHGSSRSRCIMFYTSFEVLQGQPHRSPVPFLPVVRPRFLPPDFVNQKTHALVVVGIEPEHAVEDAFSLSEAVEAPEAKAKAVQTA